MKTEKPEPIEANLAEEQAIAVSPDTISARLKEPGDLAANHPTITQL